MDSEIATTTPTAHRLPNNAPFVHPGDTEDILLPAFWQRQVSAAEGDAGDGDQDAVEFFKHPTLPLARIKKVMKSDPEVKMISAEAPILFAKACETFIQEITSRAYLAALANKRRTVSKSDVIEALARSDQFDFLIDILPRDDASIAEEDDEDDDGGRKGKKKSGKGRARPEPNPGSDVRPDPEIEDHSTSTLAPGHPPVPEKEASSSSLPEPMSSYRAPSGGGPSLVLPLSHDHNPPSGSQQAQLGAGDQSGNVYFQQIQTYLHGDTNMSMNSNSTV